VEAIILTRRFFFSLLIKGLLVWKELKINAKFIKLEIKDPQSFIQSSKATPAGSTIRRKGWRTFLTKMKFKSHVSYWLSKKQFNEDNSTLSQGKVASVPLATLWNPPLIRFSCSRYARLFWNLNSKLFNICSVFRRVSFLRLADFRGYFLFWTSTLKTLKWFITVTCECSSCGGARLKFWGILLFHSFHYQVSNSPLIFILCVTEKTHGSVVHLHAK